VVLAAYAAHVLVLVGGLTALAGLASGVVATGVVLVVLRGPSMRLGQPHRVLFDLWLLALVPAGLVTLLTVQARWPLHTRAWDGHGMGASGGEVNVCFLSWLHAVCLLVLGLLWMRSARRNAGGSIRDSPERSRGGGGSG